MLEQQFADLENFTLPYPIAGGLVEQRTTEYIKFFPDTKYTIF